MSSADEKLATLCSEWPKWLGDAVEEAMALSDKKDWSTEQVVGYAIIRGRPQPSPSADKISDAELRQIRDSNTFVNPSLAKDLASELLALRAQSAGDGDGVARYSPKASRSLPGYAVSVFEGMVSSPEGEWVKYADYLAINATQEGK